METSFHNNTIQNERYSVLLKKACLYTKKVQEIARTHDYTHPESSLAIAGDKKYQNAFTKSLVSFSDTKHVVLVGIGGSSLGTEAVYQALKQESSPTLLVLDALEEGPLKKLEALIERVHNPEHIALVIISKSGTTTAPMVTAPKALERCENKFSKSVNNRTIFIGHADTPFMKAGKRKKIRCITLPSIIGGRYSVFSAVGMVPLTLLGIDTAALRKGATDAILDTAPEHIAESAAVLALHGEMGIHTVNFFTFDDRLYRTGYWYRQLLAESIGKEKTKKGEAFTLQLLPIVSTSVDLHSMTELYLGGYKNIYTHFVSYTTVNPYWTDASHWLLEHLPLLGNKQHSFIADAIKQGVLSAYNDQKLPYRYTKLPECTAYEIGFLFATLMGEVMCLANLFGIDAFHQPSVEQYKIHTRLLLKG
jgi:glucose-6-phosphate isomerase